MTARPWFRFTPLLGALFVVLLVAGFAVGGETPDVNSTPTEIRAEYDSESQHQIAAYLVALAAFTFVFFAAHWREVLRLADARLRMANAAFGGALVMAIGFLVAALFHAALTEAANKDLVGDPALQSLNALDNWSFYPFAVGTAIFMLSSGIALVGSRRLFPPWFGWAAVVIGVLALIPLVGFFAGLAALVWILVASLMLFTRWEAVQGTDVQPPLQGT
jgi:hypothetical protein